jgi:hypothetical protein
MWRRAWFLLAGVLAVGLVLTRRRLSEAQAELDRVRAEVVATQERAAQPGLAEAAATVGETAMTGGKATAETAAAGSDLSSEWEQAVPPMDS